MRIALVHDYLIQDGGAEKVLEAMQEIWPDAPTYMLFYDPDRLPRFQDKDIRTSFLQTMPLAKRKYQWYLPLMPSATEWLDLSAFDVIVSSSSAFSKGVITKPGAVHICYCHTPTRYLWSDAQSYVEELRVPRLVKRLLPPMLSSLRVWDRQAADRVDFFLANSRTVQDRIARYYDAQSRILHPPVDTDRFSPASGTGRYFLAGGRLVPYKRVDLLVEAANRTGLPLKIFGTGPVERELRKRAAGNVEFLGKVSDAALADLYAGARAYLHPQVEDFGITAIESMAAGRPVIAYRAGGALETVIPGVTGAFLEEQSWEEIADAMIRFDDARFDPAVIRSHAERFSRERFQEKLKAVVEHVHADWPRIRKATDARVAPNLEPQAYADPD